MIKISEIQTIPHNDNNDDEKLHKATVSTKKHLKKNKQAGVENKNIVKDKRIEEKPKETEWEIEKIVGQQPGNDGKMLYKIRWKGYGESDDTWQSYKDIKDTAQYSNWLSSKTTNKK